MRHIRRHLSENGTISKCLATLFLHFASYRHVDSMWSTCRYFGLMSSWVLHNQRKTGALYFVVLLLTLNKFRNAKPNFMWVSLFFRHRFFNHHHLLLLPESVQISHWTTWLPQMYWRRTSESSLAKLSLPVIATTNRRRRRSPKTKPTTKVAEKAACSRVWTAPCPISAAANPPETTQSAWNKVREAVSLRSLCGQRRLHFYHKSSLCMILVM